MNKKLKAKYIQALQHSKPIDWDKLNKCEPWHPTLREEAVELGLRRIDGLSRKQLLKKVRRARETFCVWDAIEDQAMRDVFDNISITSQVVRYTEEQLAYNGAFMRLRMPGDPELPPQIGWSGHPV